MPIFTLCAWKLAGESRAIGFNAILVVITIDDAPLAFWQKQWAPCCNGKNAQNVVRFANAITKAITTGLSSSFG